MVNLVLCLIFNICSLHINLTIIIHHQPKLLWTSIIIIRVLLMEEKQLQEWVHPVWHHNNQLSTRWYFYALFCFFFFPFFFLLLTSKKKNRHQQASEKRENKKQASSPYLELSLSSKPSILRNDQQYLFIQKKKVNYVHFDPFWKDIHEIGFDCLVWLLDVFKWYHISFHRFQTSTKEWPTMPFFFFFLSYKRFMLTEKDSSYCRMQHLSQSKQRKNQLPKNACFRANKGVSDHSIPHHLCTLNIHLAISIPSLCHFISKETYLCRSLGIPNCTCVKWLPSSPG